LGPVNIFGAESFCQLAVFINTLKDKILRY
jgi:hypothetical protein